MTDAAETESPAAMNADDVLDVEQRKYVYEQAYALHRHTDIPALFSEHDPLFDVAGDVVTGFDAIRQKFTDLAKVSPREDSFHTGWQICTPLIDIDADGAHGRVIAPTFGYLVLNFSPEMFSPPYTVRAAFELWDDRVVKEAGGWRISELHARFLLSHPIWSWDAAHDDSSATRHEMRLIQHPFFDDGSVSA
ncbi:nuclear transport factor 2 family protein [Microbacterium sp. B19]|uniref:nuclear transport factor 2 family protein n=1 Tax=Microbacterium sp. B19 TaxID=96765 RepID=UPI000346A3CC|nr:nuclear transport factor 2 family protein [Microbacterium sp. B19]